MHHSSPSPPVTAAGERLVSLDALRGFVMLRMIIGLPLLKAVDTLPSGSIPDWLRNQLRHAPWHGLTHVDFSFAAYVMLMGVSVVVSFRRRIADPTAHSGIHYQIVRRSLLLFLIGFLYNGGFSAPFAEIRIAGILQRMAICYFVTALLFVHTTLRVQCVLLVAILLGYWALLAGVAASGHEAGDYSRNGNLVAWVDSSLLPGRGLYGDWDPEGVLSTLPAIGSCLAGLLLGQFLFSAGGWTENQRAMGLMAGGLCAVNAGIFWDQWFPINKPMWTSSYVAITAGIFSVLLGAFYYVADVAQIRWWTWPLVVIGRNLLLTFLIMGVVPLDSIVARFVGGDLVALLGSAGPFAVAAATSGLVWSLLWWMYRNNILVKI